MKKILFSVLGLSPQILTETLFALKESGELPDEIYVLTTVRGASLCKRALFQEEGGWFYRFCKDWGVSGIKFNPEHIYTIQDMNDHDLDDIRTNADNESVANQIVALIRVFTQSENTQLHVSIAGGRKTMGYYAGYALSMFGRDQDRLSHVLVSEDFEGHPQFFYPTPQSQLIRTQDGADLLDCREAKIELAYLPFLAMRSILPTHFLDEPLSYADMVKRLQVRVFDKKVWVNMDELSLTIGGESVSLSKSDFTFYCWLLWRIKEGMSAPMNPYPDEPVLDYANEYLAISKDVYQAMDSDDRSREAMQDGMNFEFVRDRRGKIKKALIKSLGETNAKDFIVHLDKKTRCFAPHLTADQIEFI